MKKITYYLIWSRTVGKREEDEEGHRDYLFKEGKWVPDKDWVIMDHLMGYDPFEPPGSPYGFGSTSVMDEIEEISEKEALRLCR